MTENDSECQNKIENGNQEHKITENGTEWPLFAENGIAVPKITEMGRDYQHTAANCR